MAGGFTRSIYLSFDPAIFDVVDRIALHIKNIVEKKDLDLDVALYGSLYFLR